MLELELLILCSRREMSDEQKGRARDILASGVSPPVLIDLALRHKILQLVAPQLIKLDTDGTIPFATRRLMDFYYAGTAQRNAVLFAEARKVLAMFRAAGITSIPLKGLVLAPSVYRDIGLRSLNDLDFLIPHDQRSAASQLLRDAGYALGTFDLATGEVEPISRQTELAWRMHVGNLHSHVALVDDPFARCVRIDLSYDVDTKKNLVASKALLADAVEGQLFGTPARMLSPVDFLIHVAIHLFKEATNVRWLEAGSNANLIKFCDLREYALAHADSLDWDEVCARATEINAGPALYYGFYFLRQLFGDPFTDEVLSWFPAMDSGVLSHYGEGEFLQRFYVDGGTR